MKSEIHPYTIEMFQSLVRMASAEAIAKLETKAVAAERLIKILRQQISQVSADPATILLETALFFR